MRGDRPGTDVLLDHQQRPAICRKFEMGGRYCREVRADYADRNARGIPLTMY